MRCAKCITEAYSLANYEQMTNTITPRVISAKATNQRTTINLHTIDATIPDINDLLASFDIKLG